MEDKMSFRERLLRIYAAVMRTFFSTHCVKCLTLRRRYHRGFGDVQNDNAELYLPGKDAELKAIDKLRLDADAIKARKWSFETKLELLARGNYALIERIRTEQEIEILVKSAPVEQICRAMSVYTPSKRYLFALIDGLDVVKLLDIIKGVPAAFDSLSAETVLGTDSLSEERCTVAYALVEARPENWVVKFIVEITSRQDGLNGELLSLLEKSVTIAMEKHIDISDYAEYFMFNHPELYVSLRRYAAANYNAEQIEPYVRKLLPVLIDKIKGLSSFGGDETPVRWVNSSTMLSEDQEATCWFYLALKNACCMDIIVSNMQDLRKKFYGQAWKYIVSTVVDKVDSVDDINKLIKFFNEDDDILKSLRDRLLNIVGDFDRGLLKDCFPFEDWNVKQAKRAVRCMARGKTLPDDISNLSEELQNVAMDELEIRSEIEVLRNGTCGDKEALILQKLHSRTEVYLLTCEYEKLVSYGLTYVQNFCMDDSTFKTVVNTNEDSACAKIENSLKKVITLHAEKWGLNQRNYKDLMQSPYYSNMAAFLRKHVRKEEK